MFDELAWAINTGLGAGIAMVPPSRAGPTVKIAAALPMTMNARTAATRRYGVMAAVLRGLPHDRIGDVTRLAHALPPCLGHGSGAVGLTDGSWLRTKLDGSVDRIGEIQRSRWLLRSHINCS